MAERTLVLALTAGLASFLSPCMLPVIPAFLAQLAGTSSNLERRDVHLSTMLSVAGFSTVFAILGVVLGAVLQGDAAEVLVWLSRIAGTTVIGLHLRGLLRLPVLERRYPVGAGSLEAGHLASLHFGASFAVAWTPCVGPLLGGTPSGSARSSTSAPRDRGPPVPQSEDGL